MHLLSPKAMLLLMLAEGTAHGADLIARADRLAGETLSPGTVYPTLRELESDGLVAVDVGEQRPASAGGRPRRYYRLTGKGSAQLDAWLPALGWAYGVMSA